MSSIASAVPRDSDQIEPASCRDLNALRRLERECFPRDAWSLLDLIGVLTLPNVVRLKAVCGEEIVGFIAADIRRSKGTAWISTIAVLPAYRRRGLGTALLRAVESRMDISRLRLNVRASNLSAIHLYESLGFQRSGSRPSYYQDGEEALIFEKGC